MQVRARGVSGRADRTERIAAQNALPGGNRYFAAMGVKRLIAVRVADGQIFAEHGALPHHADHTVGKAGKGRALIGGKVEAGMKGLLTCVRVLAPAEARGQRAVER